MADPGGSCDFLTKAGFGLDTFGQLAVMVVNAVVHFPVNLEVHPPIDKSQPICKNALTEFELERSLDAESASVRFR